MLYIFHVDTGKIITFDIQSAQSVAELKEAIERECGVMMEHQVLLMSGGEPLESHVSVSLYAAGTDTNPIYLFSKAAIESHLPPVPSIDYGSDVDLQYQFDALMAMPASYNTVVARVNLAQQCCVLAREQNRICERLVHDQHLQQQGWAAVVANLEDITQMFEVRANQFFQAFVDYLSMRQQHLELLGNFNNDLSILAKIPILPALRAQAEGLFSSDDQIGEPQPEAVPEGTEEVLSLLLWISAKDNQSSLEQAASQCLRGLGQFDSRMFEVLKSEITSILDNAKKQDMKDIKGLGDRLYTLETLMQQVKGLYREQNDLTHGFVQNQNRACHLADDSVLPDLCNSHRRQLGVMHQNHNQMRDIRRRITKAKEELSLNLHHRLKWVTYVENKLMELDGKIVMYHDSLRRLKRQTEVVQQIHVAPQMYMSAVAEVVRRRTFSQAFLAWASNLACQLLTVHSEELKHRQEFQSKFDGHFLKGLFPGLEDTPPPFATQPPPTFDSALPKLTENDMKSLKSQLPEFTLMVNMPDLNSITQFFLTKSFINSNNKKEDATSISADLTAKDECLRVPMLSDKVDFETETDTEEFEKVSQAGMDIKSDVFDGVTKIRQKQLEVGASRSVSPASSTSTNISPLILKAVELTSRSSTSSEPGSFQFPYISTIQSQLSPLTEHAENGTADTSDLAKYRHEELNFLSPIPLSLTRSPIMCDGQQHQHRHSLSGSSGSSPSVGVGATEFMATEFYMDESLPSSLSEQPTDGQHQAIVSLLQENLGNTREEVEQLRSVLKTMKTVVYDALSSVRNEMAVLRDRSKEDKNDLAEITERVRAALSLYSRECDRHLQEREQELTIDHELEITDIKKLMQSRDEEISLIKRSLVEKETELAEHERLVATMRQKLEDEQTEARDLQTCLHQQLEESLEQARIDKEAALKKIQEDKLYEITTLTDSLQRCQVRIQELEDELSSARNDQERIVKEATDKFQMEYKTELETIRSRFKLMAASTMEKSSSDPNLEKVERTDVIALANHEAILAQAKEDMKLEKAAAVRVAIQKERADCMTKLDNELRLAKIVLEEKNREVERYRMKEAALTEQCKRYKTTIRRIVKSESMVRQLLNGKVKTADTDKPWVEKKMTERKMRAILEQHENGAYPVESGIHKDISYDRLDGSQNQSDLEEVLKEKDEVQVSESKKVRLETDELDLTRLSRRLEILENNNQKLSAELQLIRRSKAAAQAEVEELKTEKARLEIELVKERAKRVFGIGPLNPETRDKEMNASVAVISDPASSRDAATSPEPTRRMSSRTCYHAASYVRRKIDDSVMKMARQGIFTVSSCNAGDTVLVLWDISHGNFAVYQNSLNLYFLHSDCMEALNVKEMNAKAFQRGVLAEVIDKEYCHARKPENRYHVPLGTKFYRVRVKPKTDEKGSLVKYDLP